MWKNSAIVSLGNCVCANVHVHNIQPQFDTPTPSEDESKAFLSSSKAHISKSGENRHQERGRKGYGETYSCQRRTGWPISQIGNQVQSLLKREEMLLDYPEERAVAYPLILHHLSKPFSLNSSIIPVKTPSPYSDPGLITKVFPTLSVPADSWMWP